MAAKCRTTKARPRVNGTCSRPQKEKDSGPTLAVGNPDAARAAVCRWYYMIVPPSIYPGIHAGADYDWPGPEYEEVEPERDARHYKVNGNEFNRGNGSR